MACASEVVELAHLGVRCGILLCARGSSTLLAAACVHAEHGTRCKLLLGCRWPCHGGAMPACMLRHWQGRRCIWHGHIWGCVVLHRWQGRGRCGACRTLCTCHLAARVREQIAHAAVRRPRAHLLQPRHGAHFCSSCRRDCRCGSVQLLQVLHVLVHHRPLYKHDMRRVRPLPWRPILVRAQVRRHGQQPRARALTCWHEQRRAAREQRAHAAQRGRVFEAVGCGHHGFGGCRRQLPVYGRRLRAHAAQRYRRAAQAWLRRQRRLACSAA